MQKICQLKLKQVECTKHCQKKWPEIRKNISLKKCKICLKYIHKSHEKLK